MPFELRPFPTETLLPEGDYLQRAWQQSIYPMAERMGVHIVLPNVSPQPYTHLAFEGYQYAKENGKGNEYNHRILTAFFQEGKDIGSVDILADLAEEVGLDKAEYKHALETRKYEDVHKKALYHAYNEANITAVPTIKIGDTMLQGMRSKETLEQIIEAEQQKKKSDPFIEGMVCGPEGCD